jgi:hypothetical protein
VRWIHRFKARRVAYTTRRPLNHQRCNPAFRNLGFCTGCDDCFFLVAAGLMVGSVPASPRGVCYPNMGRT